MAEDDGGDLAPTRKGTNNHRAGAQTPHRYHDELQTESVFFYFFVFLLRRIKKRKKILIQSSADTPLFSATPH